VSESDARAGATSARPPGRLYYLDYLRAGVVALVFLHHTAITYGASGSWYYSDAGSSALSSGLLTLLAAFDQSWFMGFLFFLSGYLSPPSYARKGAGRYVLDRLSRFGIPLMFYAFVISPLTVWLAQVTTPHHLSLLEVYAEKPFDFGVLWFVETLLLMDLLFVLWARWLRRGDLDARPGGAFPSRRALVAFIAGLGVASFLVRFALPVGATFAGLNICYYPSYIAMFVLGLVAWRRRWLDAIPDAAFRWARSAAIVGVIVLPVLLVVGSAMPNGAADFSGGPHWQALALALWEQVMLVGMSIVLLRWGQRRLNRPSPFWQGWAQASYLAYIIQPVFIVALAVLVSGAAWPALGKFALVGPLSIVAIYSAARLLRRIGPVRRVVG